MPRKDNIDLPGAIGLTLFSVLLAFNQVVVAVVNEGLQPVFFAGLRSLGSAILVYFWLRLRGRVLTIPQGTVTPGILLGVVFSVEFILLFTALDQTTVVRTSVIFYTMPLWLALMAHFWLPGERLTKAKILGQSIAFSGVALAIIFRGGPAEGGALLGDLAALGAAICWAGIAILARGTQLRNVPPDEQLLWQLAISTPILLLASLAFGPLLRDLAAVHLWGLGFQIVIVSFAGFAFWLWLLSIYPAASVAAFSFLAPVFGVFLGWWLLDEPIGMPIILALFLVVVGLILINRPVQVPQKV